MNLYWVLMRQGVLGILYGSHEDVQAHVATLPHDAGEYTVLPYDVQVVVARQGNIDVSAMAHSVNSMLDLASRQCQAARQAVDLLHKCALSAQANKTE